MLTTIATFTLTIVITAFNTTIMPGTTSATVVTIVAGLVIIITMVALISALVVVIVTGHVLISTSVVVIVTGHVIISA